MEGKIELLLLTILGVVIIVQLLSSTIGIIFTSFGYLGANLSSGGVNGSPSAGVPTIGAFFSSGGVVGLIFGVIALLIVIFLLFNMAKNARGR